jgi:hypothetical protein
MSDPVRLFDAKGIPIESTGGKLPVTETALAALIGEKQDNPTSNTLLARLKDAVTHLATIAGAQGDGYRDIGSPVRITHNSTSRSVAIPATAKAFVCMAEGGATRCEIGSAASAISAIYVAEEGSMAYPITGGTQTLFAYGTAGYGNFRFLG